MKRTEIKRKTPLRSTKPIARGRVKAVVRTPKVVVRKPRTRVKATNPKRRTAAYARNYGGPDGQHADTIRAMPCACVGRATDPEHRCRGRTVAAHEDARGMGGCGGGWADTLPLCVRHHDEAGERRGSARAAFEARYKIDLRRLADDLAQHYMPNLAKAWTTGTLAPGYDHDALFGWVRRFAARPGACPTYILGWFGDIAPHDLLAAEHLIAAATEKGLA